MEKWHCDSYISTSRIYSVYEQLGIPEISSVFEHAYVPLPPPATVTFQFLKEIPPHGAFAEHAISMDFVPTEVPDQLIYEMLENFK